MNLPKLVGVAAFSLCAVPTVARAATGAELDEAVTTVRFLKQRYEEQAYTIRALQQRVRELEQQAVAASTLSNTRGRGTVAENPSLSQAIAQVNQGLAPQAATESTQSQATMAASNADNHPGTTQAQAITSTQGIPLFDKKFSFEQGLTYTHYDKRSLALRGFLALDAILLGQINLQQIKTDQLQYDLTGRWTLSDRVSVDLNVPLVYRDSTYYSPGAGGSASAISDGSNSSTDLGDINAGIYYQLAKAAPTDLDWITSVRLRAPTGRHPFGIKLRDAAGNDNLVIPTRQPTGNGVWNVSLGLSVLKTYDPVVLFGNIGYSYNLKRSFSDLSSTQNTVTPGEVQLGNAWSLGAGLALALNDKTSVSFSFAESIQKASSLRAEGGPWVRQTGSEANSATFNAGLTNQLSKNMSMVGTVSVGLTPDAPNFSVGLKFPYTF
jgi:hypothetical protein